MRLRRLCLIPLLFWLCQYGPLPSGPYNNIDRGRLDRDDRDSSERGVGEAVSGDREVERSRIMGREGTRPY